MKKTSLNQNHRDLKARMVDFAGWDMPVQYEGVRQEHMAVRTVCGVFDVSHMGEILVWGPKALATVQRLTCNDASRLNPGDCQYSALLTEEGTFVDDIIVSRLAEDRFFICVNASNAEKDFDWMRKNALSETQIEDVSEKYCLIAVQGPESEQMLKKAWPDLTLPHKSFTIAETKISDVPVLIARTGYTGENGFEIYGPWHDAEKIWNPILAAGATPCGLGARDTLRLEAALSLYGHEIDDTTTPAEAGLNWIVKMEKSDFLGRAALKNAVPRKKLVGLEMRESGIARQGYKIFAGDREVGVITSGTFSPFLDRAVALGYVDADVKFPLSDGGLCVDIHNKKRHAEIVSLPFFKKKK